MELSLPHYFLNEQGDTLFSFGRNLQISSQPLADYHPSQPASQVAFIDRDGVVIHKPIFPTQPTQPRYHYSPKNISILENAAAAIQFLNRKKIPAVIVTNQPGIYKKLFTLQDMYAMSAEMQQQLGTARIDAVLFCPHPAPTEGDTNTRPEELCGCRKPDPGMLLAGLKIYGIAPEQAIMFGDFASDIAAAKRAGIPSAWIATHHDEYEATSQTIRTSHPEVFSQRKFDTLLEAVRKLFLG